MPTAKRAYDHFSEGEFGLLESTEQARLEVKGKRPMVGERRRPLGQMPAFFDDPILARIPVLTELPIDERLNWVLDVKAQLTLQKRTLAMEACKPSSMFDKIAKEAALEILAARLEWLEKLYELILAEHAGFVRNR